MVGGASVQAFYMLLARCLFLLFTAPALAKQLDEYPEYVTRHAPVVWLHSQDPYRPSDLLAHIHHTTPKLDGQPIGGLPLLSLDNLDVLNGHGDGIALSSNDDPLSRPGWLLGETPDKEGKLHNSTACFVILVDNKYQDLDAFYFYFYSFDQGPNITQVMKPLDQLVGGAKADMDMHFGNHVGDWEHNMVRFRDGKPAGIYYSQHRDGMAYDWDDSHISVVDERPIVYSAYGSHANYATPGDHIHDIALIDYCDEGPKWDPIQSAYFYYLNTDTFTLKRLNAPNQASPSPTSNSTAFFNYKGLWGDVSFPDSDPRQKGLPKFGFKRFVSGPNGPRFKELFRNGLMPNQRRKQGWIEYGVGIFMALYPRFFKGWRKWTTLVIVLAFLVGFGFLMKIFIGVAITKLLKREEYKKLQDEEEVLLDDWQVDDEGLISSSEDEEGDKQKERD